MKRFYFVFLLFFLSSFSFADNNKCAEGKGYSFEIEMARTIARNNAIFNFQKKYGKVKVSTEKGAWRPYQAGGVFSVILCGK